MVATSWDQWLVSHVVFFFSRAPDLIPYPSLGPHAPLRRGLVFVQASVFSWAAWGAGGRGRGGPVGGPGKVGRYGLDREGLLGKCTVMYAKGCQTLGLVKSRARLAPLRGIKKTETQKKKPACRGKPGWLPRVCMGLSAPRWATWSGRNAVVSGHGPGGRFVSSS